MKTAAKTGEGATAVAILRLAGALACVLAAAAVGQEAGAEMTLATGVDPAVGTVAPGSGAVLAGQFTIACPNKDPDTTIIDVTLNLGPAGAEAGIALVELLDTASPCGSVSNPTSNVIVVTCGVVITMRQTKTFDIRITPKTHGAMAGPLGAEYDVSPYAAAVNISTNNTLIGTDDNTNGMTIDNLSPSEATWSTITPDDGQIELKWFNPADVDFSEVVILRNTAAIGDAPVEGAGYAQGNTIGTSTVRYVGALELFTDTGLTNGTGYYYKIFAKDLNGNYALGAPTGPHAPVAAAATTTLGDGTNPGNVTLAPGGAATMLDAFTLGTNGGGDTVTALTVTLAAGSAAGLSLIELTNDAGSAVYASVNNPGSDTVAFTGLSIGVTTTTTQHKVRVTPKSHAAMPGVPGSTYAVTGTVTSITCTNPTAGTDTASATVTIDNLSPSDPTLGTVTAGDGQVALNWTNPGGDFAETLILRNASSITDFPTEGLTYASGTIGTSTVVYAGTGVTFTDSTVSNGSTYYYKLFARDTNGNWSTPGAPTGPHTPQAVTTTVGNGTDPGNQTLGPGGAITDLDAFTLQTSSGNDTVSAVVATLAAGTSVGIAQVAITNAAGTTTYGTVSNPAGDTVSVTLSQNITATSSVVTYKVRITPKSHLAMPAAPGATYTVTGTVTAITSSNAKVYNDTASATITIDNQSPADVTWGSNTVANGEVTLNWTNPGSDFAQVVLVRHTSAIGTATEGQNYNVGNALGGGTVVYVGTGTTHTDTGVSNGTAYYYKAFTKDDYGNYALGLPAGPYTPSDVDSDAPCAATDFQVTGRTPTSLTIQFTAPFENCTGTSGDPAEYMVRYAYAPINTSSWSSANVWNDAYPASAAAGSPQTITVVGLESNQRYWIQVKAVDLATNVGPLAALAGSGTDSGRTYLHNGWNMGGPEGVVGATNTCVGVFGLSTCYWWSSTGVRDWAGSYVIPGAVETGRGYFLSVAGSTSELGAGGTTATTGQRSLGLQKGMNLVVNPHPAAVDLANVTVTSSAAGTVSWATAVGNGWVAPAVYAYDGTNYGAEVYNALPPGKLHPRKAYWLKLAVDDANTYTLNIPKP